MTRELLRIKLIGAAGTGKTSIRNLFCYNYLKYYYDPTIGSEFSCVNKTIESSSYTLQIWDEAGNNINRGIKHVPKEVDAIFIVFNLNNLYGVEDLKEWIRIAENHHTYRYLYLIANKSDLNPTLDSSSIIKFATLNKLNYYEVSAIDKNVNKPFEDIVNQLHSDLMREKNKHKSHDQLDFEHSLHNDNYFAQFNSLNDLNTRFLKHYRFVQSHSLNSIEKNLWDKTWKKARQTAFEIIKTEVQKNPENARAAVVCALNHCPQLLCTHRHNNGLLGFFNFFRQTKTCNDLWELAETYQPGEIFAI